MLDESGISVAPPICWDCANKKANTKGDGKNDTDRCGKPMGFDAGNNAPNAEVVGHDQDSNDKNSDSPQSQALISTANLPTNDTNCNTTTNTGMGYVLYCQTSSLSLINFYC